VTRREPEWALVTVLFADVRGWTAYADRATARDAAAFLERFFDAAIPAVTREGGHVHQLLGDGLLAVFDAPDHPDRALAAGRSMLAAVDCPIGVGLNTGLVLTGTMGGGGHYVDGIVGDPVNVAARVQDATKALGDPLLLTEATRALLSRGHPALVARGRIALRGKAAPVAVHALLDVPVTVAGRPGRTIDHGCTP
jgi:class 3 adenylate cyclase